MISTRLLQAAIVLVYVLLGSSGLYMLKSASIARPEQGPAFAMVIESVWNTVTNARFIIGFMLYAASFTTWMVLLRLMPLSIAFPIATSAMLITTQLIGVLVLSEKITSIHIVGLTLILLGVSTFFFTTPAEAAASPERSAMDTTVPSAPLP